MNALQISESKERRLKPKANRMQTESKLNETESVLTDKSENQRIMIKDLLFDKNGRDKDAR